MPEYPPPPPGHSPGWPPPFDPYAADRALASYAKERDCEIAPAGDVRWYQAWYPFVYLPLVSQVGRELRAELDGAHGYRKGGADAAKVWVIEGFESDPIKQATGEHKRLYAFVTSSKLTYRAAVRSKQGAGIVDDIGKGLDSLFSSPKLTGVLGDATFEASFDVSAPTRDEAQTALPMALRSQLVSSRWRGILELRAGGLAAAFFETTAFEPYALDRVLGWVQSTLALATAYDHPVTPPPRP